MQLFMSTFKAVAKSTQPSVGSFIPSIASRVSAAPHVGLNQGMCVYVLEEEISVKTAFELDRNRLLLPYFTSNIASSS
jgi:hypothetical protein